MLSTTTHLTTDIVAMPLLWVLPLGLYLLSFVIAFAGAGAARPTSSPCSRRSSSWSPAGSPSAAARSNPFFSATLGPAAAVRRSRSRSTPRCSGCGPAVGHLTRFYLAMSFGGMLGGLFCAIVAPLAVRLGLRASAADPRRRAAGPADAARALAGAAAAGCCARAAGRWPCCLSYRRRRAACSACSTATLRRWSAASSISLIALACLGRRWPFARRPRRPDAELWRLGDARADPARATAPAPISASTRSARATTARARVLTHGTTLHGIQNLTPGPRDACRPSYYARRSGVGLALANADALYGAASADRRGRPRQRHARPATPSPSQSWTFFEIDPAMVEVARNRFTFLAQLRAAGPDRARRRAAQPRPAAAPTRSTCSPSTPSRRTRCRCTCSPARRSHVYGRARAARRHRPVPHLQPLSRPQAGDRRHRRARRLDARRCWNMSRPRRRR